MRSVNVNISGSCCETVDLKTFSKSAGFILFMALWSRAKVH